MKAGIIVCHVLKARRLLGLKVTFQQVRQTVARVVLGAVVE